jgi:hypothetical protein
MMVVVMMMLMLMMMIIIIIIIIIIECFPFKGFSRKVLISGEFLLLPRAPSLPY